MADENKEPTFIDQAFALIEEHYAIPNADKEHGMKIGDHKLLCQILNAHETYIDEKVVKTFCDAIAEHYKPIMRVLNDIQDSQKDISKEIAEIHRRLDVGEEKIRREEIMLNDHEKRLQTKRKRIEELENKFAEQKRVIETLALVEPTLKRLQAFFMWWTWWKVVIAILTVIALFVALFIGTNFYMHKHGYVTYEKTCHMDQIWADIKTGNISNDVRSVQMPKTDRDRDSTEAQIYRMIKK